MGSQCSFSRRGVEWWWRGAKRTSLAAKFLISVLERLDDRIRCTHEETVAVVKPWKDIGSNKSLGCVCSEKPADWTNAFKLEKSSWADFYDVLPHGQFWVKNESKVPGRIREGDVVWEPRVIESGRETVEGFKEDEKGKRRASVLSSFSLGWFSVVPVLCRLCMHWVLWWSWSLHWVEQISRAVICEKLMV